MASSSETGINKGNGNQLTAEGSVPSIVAALEEVGLRRFPSRKVAISSTYAAFGETSREPSQVFGARLTWFTGEARVSYLRPPDVCSGSQMDKRLSLLAHYVQVEINGRRGKK